MTLDEAVEIINGWSDKTKYVVSDDKVYADENGQLLFRYTKPTVLHVAGLIVAGKLDKHRDDAKKGAGR